jgi:hypothetical protein
MKFIFPDDNATTITMNETRNQSSKNSRCCGDMLPWLMLIGLIIFGFSSRLLIADVPNFKPIAAIALFSGFYFRKTWMALLTIALALLISDWQIGSYHWPIALSVYGSLLAGCLVGRFWIGQNGQKVQHELSRSDGLKLGAAAFTMSCLFFVVTNFAVWASGVWYPPGAEGLVSCYQNAVPFFKYTLAGDLFFTATIFGSYAMMSAFVFRKSNVAHNVQLPSCKS